MPIPAKFQRFLNEDGTLKTKNPYDILGITSPFTEGQLREVLKKLMLEYHPDKNPGPDNEYATTVFKAIQNAREALTSPSTSNPDLEPAGWSEKDDGGYWFQTLFGFSRSDFEELKRRASARERSKPASATDASGFSAPAPALHAHMPISPTMVKFPCVISITKTHRSFETYHVIFKDKEESLSLRSCLKSQPVLGKDLSRYQTLSIHLNPIRAVNVNLHEYGSKSERAIPTLHGADTKIVFIAGGLDRSDDDRASIEAIIHECQGTYPGHDLYTVHLDDGDNIHLEPFGPDSFERAYTQDPVTSKKGAILGPKLLQLTVDYIERAILSSTPPPKVENTWGTFFSAALGFGAAASAPKEDGSSTRRP